MTNPAIRARLAVALAASLALAGAATSQQAEKTDKASDQKTTDQKTATIEITVPEGHYHPTQLKIEGKETKSTGQKRVFTTPPLEAGKTYQYKIEINIQPNNYTQIIRTKEVTFKPGDKVTLDMGPPKSQKGDDVRIRWVPTPKDIVIEMGKLAKIGKDDIVYDLGCGDGIMIITAVKEMGAKKGVGIDIDPKKVAESKENAEKEGIKDKIEIREGNILKLTDKDIGDATVVMLYLGNEMQRQLRPILWDGLKPGTRIVSHRFIMDDWKPEKTITVKGEDGEEYTLHLWTITGKEKEGKYEKTDKTDE
jgi:uncharacterized protein (TIGR03000 family)